MGFYQQGHPFVGLHVAREHLAGGFLIAVNQQVAALGAPVAHDQKSRAGEINVPPAEEREPSESQQFPARAAGVRVFWRCAQWPSSPGGFLCLGRLRVDLGRIGLEAGTRPTLSRAMAFTSLPRLN